VDASGDHGFLLSGGVYTTLDDMTGAQASNTVAIGINNAGQIVGTFHNASGQHGFLLSGGIYTTLDDPLSTVHDTVATGINDAGQIVGFYFDSAGAHGFLYSGGIFTTIDNPSATAGTEAFGINDNGQIVGFFGDGSGGHGFLETTVPNPAAPPGTTTDMVLRAANTSPIAGHYEIYDIGNNAILAGYSLGQVGTDWGFVTLGGFQRRRHQ